MGMVQIYCGHGKGKTTAAFGQALRMIGHRKKSLVVQFLKGSIYSGELWSAERLAPYLRVIQAGRGCCYAGLIKAGLMECTGCGSCFEEREDRANPPRLAGSPGRAGWSWQLVVLDELGHALSRGYLTEEEVLAALAGRAEGVDVVLTGRDFPPKVMEAADLITEMRLVKHPFEKGCKARLGIEY